MKIMLTRFRLIYPATLTIILFIQTFSSNGQVSQNEGDKRSVAEMTAYGNKIFVTANHQYTKIHAVRFLEEWGYWKVVDDRSDADFVLQIISEPVMMSEYKAYAIINEPISGKARYKTGTVNTLGTISYHGRKAVVRRLINWIKDEIEKSEEMKVESYRKLY